MHVAHGPILRGFPSICLYVFSTELLLSEERFTVLKGTFSNKSKKSKLLVSKRQQRHEYFQYSIVALLKRQA